MALGATDATPAFNLSDATGYPTSSLTGTITNAQLAGSIANDKLAGSIANDKLANNTISFGGISLALGGTDATPAFDLSDATGYPTSSLSGTITNTQLAGSIVNSKLANSGKLNDSTNVFYSEATVTVNGSSKYVVDGTQQQELHLQKGMTYRFNQSDNSNNSHPFRFSTTSNGTHNSGSNYTTGVTEVGTPGSSGSYTQIIVQQDTPTLYYYCGAHSGMGGKAVIDIQEKLTTGSVTNDMLAGTIPIAKGGTGATSAAAARTALGVDASGTDNSTNVTLATVSNNYLTLSGQAITAGTVPLSLGGTGATTASAARTALGVDAAGTDNSTNVTLATVSGNYLTLSGQSITAGTVPVSLGGTGATSAAAARTALGAINGLTVKQDGTGTSNDATYTTITTLIFDYDAGLQVSSPSTGEAKITLGSHWKTIQIDGTNAVTPSGEETLNLIKGTGINITGNSGSTPQSLTFSINAALNDLSNVSAGSPSTNDVLKWNGSSWVPGSVSSGGATSLNGLSDVLVENNSIFLGSDPSSTTNNAQYNVSVGINALDAITTGDNNVAVGYKSLTANTEGHDNISIGYESLESNTTGYENIALGSVCLESNTSGYSNIAFGYRTLRYNTTGTYNIGIGYMALRYNTTSDFNIGIGKEALGETTTGSKNVGIGAKVMMYNTTGESNVAVGYGALQSNTTGEGNVVIGSFAGNVLTTGQKNVIIGNSARCTSNNVDDAIVIGNDARDHGSNIVVIGNDSITAWHPGDDNSVDLGSTSYSFKDAHIQGVIYASTLNNGASFTLPTGQGSNGQVLTNNGSGTLSWTTLSSGATSLDGLSDVSVSSNQITFGSASTTAILPADDNGVDLGSESYSFKDAHIQGIIYASTLNNGASFTLPTGQGSSGQVLTNNGSGTLSWTTPSSGGSSTFTGLTGTPSSFTGHGGKFLKVNSTPDAVEFASFALSDIPSGGASTGQVLKWTGSAWAPGTDSTGSGGGGGGGGSSTGTLGVYNATGDAKVMVETDGSDASDVAKLVLQKGTAVANLNWNGTTLEIDKPLSLGSSLTASTANSDVLLVGSGTGFQVKKTSIALSSLLTTSSSVTNVGTLSSLTISGDLTVNGSTTTVSTTNTVITDNIIELSNGTSGTPSNDSGIIIERGSSDNVFMGWDESADKFLMGTTTATGISTGNLSVTTGTLVANLEGNVTGNITGSVLTASQTGITGLGTITTGVWNATAIADGYISSAATWNAKQSALTFGKSSGNALKSEEALVTNNVLLMGTTNVKGRTYSEFKGDLSLDYVENTTISTWSGTTNITTVGTIGTGTWNATAIADGKIASAATWNAKQDALSFNAPSSNNANPSTSAQIKTALDLKANLASPNFTGQVSISGTDLGLTHLSDVTVSGNEITLGTASTTAILPADDNGVDLGSTSYSFKDAHIQGVIHATQIKTGTPTFTLPTADGSNGQFLKTNGSGTLSWDTASGGGGASALNDLTDVSTSGAQSNYALVYNGSSWAPAAQSGSGGGGTHFSGTVSANVVYQRMTDITTISVAANGGKTEIEGLRLTITPQSSSSKVELNYNIFHEANNYNYGFLVSRTVGGTETFFRIANATNDLTFSASYHDEYSSLPQTTSYSMIDEPNTAGVVVYKVYGSATHTTAITLYINRTKNDGSETGQEHGISTSSVKEFSNFTHNIAEQKVQGRVLETLVGVFDGRSVTVSSGTYTLTDVTAVQSVNNTTTWTDLTNTSISYKPPVGTRQVKIRYTVATDDGGSATRPSWRLLIEGSVYTNQTMIEQDYQVYNSETKNRIFVIDINGTDDMANGKLASWNTLKTVKLQVQSGTYETIYNQTRTTTDSTLLKPSIEIQAIGEENLVYNLTNQYSITEGQTLETLAGVCDGRTVTVSSGTYTFGNVIAEYDPPRTSWGNPPNMGISYKPPPGTKQVVYKIKIYQTYKDTADIYLKYKLYIDGVGVDDSVYADCTERWTMMYQEFSYIIRIGEGNDPSNGKFSSWDSLKLLETRVTDFGPSDSWERYLHSSMLDDSLTNDLDTNRGTIRKPKIEIKAIGKGVIEGTIGNLYSSKVNMVNIKMEEQFTKSITASAKVELEKFRMTIVPVHVDSKFEINYSIFNEMGSYNAGFVISRTVNGTETLFTPGGNDGTSDFTFGVFYESDYASTAQNSAWSMIDEPGTTDPILYKIYAKSTSDSFTLAVNRTISSGNHYNEEGVSFCSVKELPQQTTLHNPRYNSVIEQEGQILETLSGVCDGRSVSGSSGTYTFEEVTTGQEVPSTWTKATGSGISYKPPPGTKVVKFSYRYAMRTHDNNTDLWHQLLYLDNTAVTFSQETIRPGSSDFETINEYSVIFSIGGTTDVANGKLASWDTLKTIEVRMGAVSNRNPKLHNSNHSGPAASGTDLLILPQITIQAIGRKSDTTFLNSFFNERKGQVLETLAGVCDGRTIEVDSGTYTLPNVTTEYTPTAASWVLCTGSSIDYKPPPGTKQVTYCYTVATGRVDNKKLLTFRFKIGDAVVVKQIRNIGWSNSVYGNLYNLRFVIDIGTDDISNGRVISWDSLKNLKVEIYQYNNTYENKLHYNQYYETASDVSGYTFTRPSLEIQAIGDAAIQNATVVAGHSMVHFQGYTASRKSFTLDTGTAKAYTFYDYSYHSGNYNMIQYKNIGGCMNNSTGEFTFPHTGLYSINMTAQMSDSNNNPRTYVYWQMNKTKGTYEGPSEPNVILCELPGYRERSTSSKILHFQAGESFIIHSGTSTQPYDIYLSITALQDQVPQAISARPGMTLETLAGVCDGRSVTVSSGTYTMPNVTTYLESSDSTWKTLTGSELSYKPPPGTKQVIYNLSVKTGYTGGSDSYIMQFFKFYIDGQEVTNNYAGGVGENGIHYGGLYQLKYVIDIGTNDIADGRVSSWDSLKSLKIEVQSYGSDYDIRYHWNAYKSGGGYSTSSDQQLCRPSLTIQAIGDGPGIVPSTGMNVVKVSTGTTASYTPPKSSPGVEIEELKISIKPTATDSVISLKWDVFCDGYRNLGFRVTRNITGTDVLVYDDSKGVKGSFLAMVPFDETGTTSTQTSPQTAQISWHDEPNTTSEVTYKLWVGNSWNTNEGFFLNKCMHSTDSDGREYGVSSVIAIEYPKTARPLDTENALTIPPFVGATNKEKLYNQSGDLYFNGKQLSNEWYKNGGDLYRFGGNVGIGKSSPSYKLDVTGDINFTGSIRQNGVGFQLGGLWSGSSNAYRSSGMVGFGTSSFVDTVRNPNGIHIVNSSGISFQANTSQTDSRNWRIRHDDLADWGSLQISVGDTNSDVPDGSDNAVMTMLRSGYVGIGTTSPSFPLHINTHASGTTASSEKAYWYSGETTTTAGGSYSVSLRTSHVIWCGTGVIVSSDQRIKTNIREVPDNLSLQKLRDISCCYYDYKDKVNRGSSSTIGFIAQQVKEHMPMAVSIQTEIIPSVYKVISCEWTGNVMYSQELGTVSGVKYKFYVSNTNDDEVEKIVTGSSDNTFTFEQQWNKVFCYGKEVDDFHTVDKNKLFALNFSATQELDRQQQADKAKISSLETEVASLKTTLASQQTLIQSLMTRLEALENP